MNEKNNNRDLMSLLEDKYILEAEPAGTARKKTKHFKLSVAAAVVAACVGVTAVTAGAVIYKNTRSSPETMYDSRAEEILDSKGLIRNEVMSNEHFDVKLDTVLADDLTYQIMFTIEPKDEAAINFVKKCRSNDAYFDFKITNSNNDEEYRGYSSVPYIPEDGGSIMLSMNGQFDKNFRDKFSDGKLYFSFKGAGLFDNIGFTVKPEKNLETRTVTLKGGNTLYVSPIGLATISKDRDHAERPRSISFIWKEGGRERFLESLGITPEEDAAALAEDKWVEADYILLGKRYKDETAFGLGGGGVGFWLDGDTWITTEGDWAGEGEYVQTMEFGCVIDLDDVEGIRWGIDEYRFND